MDIKVKNLPKSCWSSKPLVEINGVIIHYISAVNVDPERKYDMDRIFQLFVDLNNPKPGEQKYYASAHYLVGRDGNALELVPLYQQAYHAGVSQHKGRQNCNGWTVGIELVGEYNVPFTEEQYVSCARLVRYIKSLQQSNFKIERNLTESDVVGHEHVAPNRKKDPGPSFDWNKFWDLLKV